MTEESIINLNRILSLLNRFLYISSQHAFPFYKFIRKKITFEWKMECKEDFIKPKNTLAQPPVKSRLMEDETLFV